MAKHVRWFLVLVALLIAFASWLTPLPISEPGGTNAEIERIVKSANQATDAGMPVLRGNEARIVVIAMSSEGQEQYINQEIMNDFWMGAKLAFKLLKPELGNNQSVDLVLMNRDPLRSDLWIRNAVSSPHTLAIVAAGSANDARVLNIECKRQGVPAILANAIPIQLADYDALVLNSPIDLDAVADAILKETEACAAESVCVVYERSWADWCGGSTRLKEHVQRTLDLPNARVIRIGRSDDAVARVRRKVLELETELVVYLGDDQLDSRLTDSLSVNGEQAVPEFDGIVIHVSDRDYTIPAEKHIQLRSQHYSNDQSSITVQDGRTGDEESTYPQAMIEAILAVDEYTVPAEEYGRRYFWYGFDAVARIMNCISNGHTVRHSIRIALDNTNLDINGRQYTPLNNNPIIVEASRE